MVQEITAAIPEGGKRTDVTAMTVALLTGGGDRPYALGLSSALDSQGIAQDFIGSDELDSPQLRESTRVKFFNLRGNQSPTAGRARKVWRVITYYLRLIRYSLNAKPGIFHILWNNKFEVFDRTALTAYYKVLGKKVVMTAHNVNAAKRDANDTFINRLTLRLQYRMVDHIFVHTDQMKRELRSDYGVAEQCISVIPFGINRTVPDTALTAAEAKERLGLKCHEKVVLFFGNIAPYKGLEHLVEAMGMIAPLRPEYRLVIAGRVKEEFSYWRQIQDRIARLGMLPIVKQRIEYIPDEETEIYFKAADLLVLPYKHIYHSGVLFLGYSFGLPVVASDVGSLKEDILEGKTGWVCKPENSQDLAKAIEEYFQSELFRNLNVRRLEIQRFANERYSWEKVGVKTCRVYRHLLG
jgi:glycosyltransferase involved in cell wall biosynthesis